MDAYEYMDQLGDKDQIFDKPSKVFAFYSFVLKKFKCINSIKKFLNTKHVTWIALIALL